ncbi:MAG: hypothetical protein Q9M91_00270 [Candidatus Dojkabacteria bacterium]|nr:hypothetical protein [Candidatus Dojkabacteria bacterium]MDQ7020267.1 hypothetical protein [Candidatus Dojkabacteria bacterium]
MYKNKKDKYITIGVSAVISVGIILLASFIFVIIDNAKEIRNQSDEIDRLEKDIYKVASYIKSTEMKGDEKLVVIEEPIYEGTSLTSLTAEDLSFNVTYTSNLELSVGSMDNATIMHSVYYPHQNVCEMRDYDYREIENIVDVRFDIIRSRYEIYASAELYAPILTDNNYISEAGEVTLVPGFIEEYSTGTMTGYSIYTGAEGCGEYTYLFPIDENNTLIITRLQVGEFGYAAGDLAEEYMSVDGVVLPEEEERLFNEIVESITLK